MALTIPASTYYRFQFDPELGTRYGQQFYDYMAFQKITNPFDRVWCDKIYNAPQHIVRQMILTVLDNAN